MKQKLLIVDDHLEIQKQFKDYFEKVGFAVSTASDGMEMMDNLSKICPDLIILDVILPGRDGLYLCQELRRQFGYSIGIIMISSIRREELDQEMGLRIGADVYMTKPFETALLLAQVNALLRRIKTQQELAVQSGWLIVDSDLQIHLVQQRVIAGSQEVALTQLEFKLLKYLVERPGIPCARADLLDQVWGIEEQGLDVSDNALRASIGGLRKKIEPNTSEPRFILTVHGRGYKFKSL